MINHPTNLPSPLSPVIQELRKANDQSADVKTQSVITALLLKLELQNAASHARMTADSAKLATQLTQEKRNNKVLRQLMTVVSPPKAKREDAALN